MFPGIASVPVGAMMNAPTILLALLLGPSASAASMPSGMSAADGPQGVEIPYETTDPVEARERWEADQQLLQRYERVAAVAVTGTIIHVGEGPTRDGPHQVVSIMVEDALRGDAPVVMEVRVDPPSMDPARPAPKLISGYRVLAFVDGGGWLVDGDAMFALEAGWAWRNRRASTFFKPRLDHDWAVAMDPYDDYVAFNLHEIEERMSGRVPWSARRR